MSGAPQVIPGEVIVKFRAGKAEDVTGARGLAVAEERSRIEGQVCTWYGRAADKYDDDSIECPFDDGGSAETAAAAR